MIKRSWAIKNTAIFTAVCFTFTTFFSPYSVQASSLETAPALLPAANSPVEKIHIPAEWGEVFARHQGSTDTTVVLLQDAHVHLEAQLNIANIIRHLAGNYGLNLVHVEGAEGFLYADHLASYPNAKARQTMAYHFMKEGKITGPEYAVITDAAQVALFGVENMALYEANRQVFLQALEYKDKDQAVLAELRKILENSARKIFSADMAELIHQREAFYRENGNLLAYLNVLSGLAEKNKTDLTVYPQIQDFLKLSRLNASLNELEMTREAEKLRRKMPAVSVPAGEAAQELLVLAEAVQSEGGALEEFPQARLLLESRDVQNRIDAGLFEDVKRLNAALEAVLLTGEEQKELAYLFRVQEILEKIFNFELTHDDADFFFKNRQDFSAAVYEKSLRAFAGSDLALPAELSRLDEDLRRIEMFYQFALKRDQAMIQNALQKISQENEKLTVLVAGGFHTAGFQRALQERGISYLSVRPVMKQSMDEKEHNRLYVASLRQETEQFASMLVNSYLPEKSTQVNDPRYQLSGLKAMLTISDAETMDRIFAEEGGLAGMMDLIRDNPRLGANIVFAAMTALLDVYETLESGEALDAAQVLDQLLNTDEDRQIRGKYQQRFANLNEALYSLILNPATQAVEKDRTVKVFGDSVGGTKSVIASVRLSNGRPSAGYRREVRDGSSQGWTITGPENTFEVTLGLFDGEGTALVRTAVGLDATVQQRRRPVFVGGGDDDEYDAALPDFSGSAAALGAEKIPAPLLTDFKSRVTGAWTKVRGTKLPAKTDNDAALQIVLDESRKQQAEFAAVDREMNPYRPETSSQAVPAAALEQMAPALAGRVAQTPLAVNDSLDVAKLVQKAFRAIRDGRAITHDGKRPAEGNELEVIETRSANWTVLHFVAEGIVLKLSHTEAGGKRYAGEVDKLAEEAGFPARVPALDLKFKTGFPENYQQLLGIQANARVVAQAAAVFTVKDALQNVMQNTALPEAERTALVRQILQAWLSTQASEWKAGQVIDTDMRLDNAGFYSDGRGGFVARNFDNERLARRGVESLRDLELGTLLRNVWYGARGFLRGLAGDNADLGNQLVALLDDAFQAQGIFPALTQSPDAGSRLFTAYQNHDAALIAQEQARRAVQKIENEIAAKTQARKEKQDQARVEKDGVKRLSLIQQVADAKTEIQGLEKQRLELLAQARISRQAVSVASANIEQIIRELKIKDEFAALATLSEDDTKLLFPATRHYQRLLASKIRMLELFQTINALEKQIKDGKASDIAWGEMSNLNEQVALLENSFLKGPAPAILRSRFDAMNGAYLQAVLTGRVNYLSEALSRAASPAAVSAVQFLIEEAKSLHARNYPDNAESILASTEIGLAFSLLDQVGLLAKGHVDIAGELRGEPLAAKRINALLTTIPRLVTAVNKLIQDIDLEGRTNITEPRLTLMLENARAAVLRIAADYEKMEADLWQRKAALLAADAQELTAQEYPVFPALRARVQDMDELTADLNRRLAQPFNDPANKAALEEIVRGIQKQKEEILLKGIRVFDRFTVEYKDLFRKSKADGSIIFAKSAQNLTLAELLGRQQKLSAFQAEMREAANIAASVPAADAAHQADMQQIEQAVAVLGSRISSILSNVDQRSRSFDFPELAILSPESNQGLAQAADDIERAIGVSAEASFAPFAQIPAALRGILQVREEYFVVNFDAADAGVLLNTVNSLLERVRQHAAVINEEGAIPSAAPRFEVLLGMLENKKAQLQKTVNDREQSAFLAAQQADMKDYRDAVDNGDDVTRSLEGKKNYLINEEKRLRRDGKNSFADQLRSMISELDRLFIRNWIDHQLSMIPDNDAVKNVKQDQLQARLQRIQAFRAWMDVNNPQREILFLQDEAARINSDLVYLESLLNLRILQKKVNALALKYQTTVRPNAKPRQTPLADLDPQQIAADNAARIALADELQVRVSEYNAAARVSSLSAAARVELIDLQQELIAKESEVDALSPGPLRDRAEAELAELKEAVRGALARLAEAVEQKKLFEAGIVNSFELVRGDSTLDQIQKKHARAASFALRVNEAKNLQVLENVELRFAAAHKLSPFLPNHYTELQALIAQRKTDIQTAAAERIRKKNEKALLLATDIKENKEGGIDMALSVLARETENIKKASKLEKNSAAYAKWFSQMNVRVESDLEWLEQMMKKGDAAAGVKPGKVYALLKRIEDPEISDQVRQTLKETYQLFRNLAESFTAQHEAYLFAATGVIAEVLSAPQTQEVLIAVGDDAKVLSVLGNKVKGMQKELSSFAAAALGAEAPRNDLDETLQALLAAQQAASTRAGQMAQLREEDKNRRQIQGYLAEAQRILRTDTSRRIKPGLQRDLPLLIRNMEQVSADQAAKFGGADWAATLRRLRDLLTRLNEAAERQAQREAELAAAEEREQEAASASAAPEPAPQTRTFWEAARQYPVVTAGITAGVVLAGGVIAGGFLGSGDPGASGPAAVTPPGPVDPMAPVAPLDPAADPAVRAAAARGAVPAAVPAAAPAAAVPAAPVIAEVELQIEQKRAQIERRQREIQESARRIQEQAEVDQQIRLLFPDLESMTLAQAAGPNYPVQTGGELGRQKNELDKRDRARKELTAKLAAAPDAEKPGITKQIEALNVEIKQIQNFLVFLERHIERLRNLEFELQLAGTDNAAAEAARHNAQQQLWLERFSTRQELTLDDTKTDLEKSIADLQKLIDFALNETYAEGHPDIGTDRSDGSGKIRLGDRKGRERGKAELLQEEQDQLKQKWNHADQTLKALTRQRELRHEDEEIRRQVRGENAEERRREYIRLKQAAEDKRMEAENPDAWERVKTARADREAKQEATQRFRAAEAKFEKENADSKYRDTIAWFDVYNARFLIPWQIAELEKEAKTPERDQKIKDLRARIAERESNIRRHDTGLEIEKRLEDMKVRLGNDEEARYKLDMFELTERLAFLNRETEVLPEGRKKTDMLRQREQLEAQIARRAAAHDYLAAKKTAEAAAKADGKTFDYEALYAFRAGWFDSVLKKYDEEIKKLNPDGKTIVELQQAVDDLIKAGSKEAAAEKAGELRRLQILLGLREEAKKDKDSADKVVAGIRVRRELDARMKDIRDELVGLPRGELYELSMRAALLKDEIERSRPDAADPRVAELIADREHKLMIIEALRLPHARALHEITKKEDATRKKMIAHQKQLQELTAQKKKPSEALLKEGPAIQLEMKMNQLERQKAEAEFLAQLEKAWEAGEITDAEMRLLAKLPPLPEPAPILYVNAEAREIIRAAPQIVLRDTVQIFPNMGLDFSDAELKIMDSIVARMGLLSTGNQIFEGKKLNAVKSSELDSAMNDLLKSGRLWTAHNWGQYWSMIMRETNLEGFDDAAVRLQEFDEIRKDINLFFSTIVDQARLEAFESKHTEVVGAAGIESFVEESWDKMLQIRYGWKDNPGIQVADMIGFVKERMWARRLNARQAQLNQLRLGKIFELTDGNTHPADWRNNSIALLEVYRDILIGETIEKNYPVTGFANSRAYEQWWMAQYDQVTQLIDRNIELVRNNEAFVLQQVATNLGYENFHFLLRKINNIYDEYNLVDINLDLKISQMSIDLIALLNTPNRTPAQQVRLVYLENELYLRRKGQKPYFPNRRSSFELLMTPSYVSNLPVTDWSALAEQQAKDFLTGIVGWSQSLQLLLPAQRKEQLISQWRARVGDEKGDMIRVISRQLKQDIVWNAQATPLPNRERVKVLRSGIDLIIQQDGGFNTYGADAREQMRELIMQNFLLDEEARNMSPEDLLEKKVKPFLLLLKQGGLDRFRDYKAEEYGDLVRKPDAQGTLVKPGMRSEKDLFMVLIRGQQDTLHRDELNYLITLIRERRGAFANMNDYLLFTTGLALHDEANSRGGMESVAVRSNLARIRLAYVGDERAGDMNLASNPGPLQNRLRRWSQMHWETAQRDRLHEIDSSLIELLASLLRRDALTFLMAQQKEADKQGIPLVPDPAGPTNQRTALTRLDNLDHLRTDIEIVIFNHKTEGKGKALRIFDTTPAGHLDLRENADEAILGRIEAELNHKGIPIWVFNEMMHTLNAYKVTDTGEVRYPLKESAWKLYQMLKGKVPTEAQLQVFRTKGWQIDSREERDRVLGFLVAETEAYYILGPQLYQRQRAFLDEFLTANQKAPQEVLAKVHDYVQAMRNRMWPAMADIKVKTPRSFMDASSLEQGTTRSLLQAAAKPKAKMEDELKRLDLRTKLIAGATAVGYSDPAKQAKKLEELGITLDQARKMDQHLRNVMQGANQFYRLVLGPDAQFAEINARSILQDNQAFTLYSFLLTMSMNPDKTVEASINDWNETYENLIYHMRSFPSDRLIMLSMAFEAVKPDEYVTKSVLDPLTGTYRNPADQQQFIRFQQNIIHYYDSYMDYVLRFAKTLPAAKKPAPVAGLADVEVKPLTPERLGVHNSALAATAKGHPADFYALPAQGNLIPAIAEKILERVTPIQIDTDRRRAPLNQVGLIPFGHENPAHRGLIPEGVNIRGNEETAFDVNELIPFEGVEKVPVGPKGKKKVKHEVLPANDAQALRKFFTSHSRDKKPLTKKPQGVAWLRAPKDPARPGPWKNGWEAVLTINADGTVTLPQLGEDIAIAREGDLGPMRVVKVSEVVMEGDDSFAATLIVEGHRYFGEVRIKADLDPVSGKMTLDIQGKYTAKGGPGSGMNPRLAQKAAAAQNAAMTRQLTFVEVQTTPGKHQGVDYWGPYYTSGKHIDIVTPPFRTAHEQQIDQTNDVYVWRMYSAPDRDNSRQLVNVQLLPVPGQQYQTYYESMTPDQQKAPETVRIWTGLPVNYVPAPGATVQSHIKVTVGSTRALVVDPVTHVAGPLPATPVNWVGTDVAREAVADISGEAQRLQEEHRFVEWAFNEIPRFRDALQAADARLAALLDSDDEFKLYGLETDGKKGKEGGFRSDDAARQMEIRNRLDDLAKQRGVDAERAVGMLRAFTREGQRTLGATDSARWSRYLEQAKLIDKTLRDTETGLQKRKALMVMLILRDITVNGDRSMHLVNLSPAERTQLKELLEMAAKDKKALARLLMPSERDLDAVLRLRASASIEAAGMVSVTVLGTAFNVEHDAAAKTITLKDQATGAVRATYTYDDGRGGVLGFREKIPVEFVMDPAKPAESKVKLSLVFTDVVARNRTQFELLVEDPILPKDIFYRTGLDREKAFKWLDVLVKNYEKQLRTNSIFSGDLVAVAKEATGINGSVQDWNKWIRETLRVIDLTLRDLALFDGEAKDMIAGRGADLTVEEALLVAGLPQIQQITEEDAEGNETVRVANIPAVAADRVLAQVLSERFGVAVDIVNRAFTQVRELEARTGQAAHPFTDAFRTEAGKQVSVLADEISQIALARLSRGLGLNALLQEQLAGNIERASSPDMQALLEAMRDSDAPSDGFILAALDAWQQSARVDNTGTGITDPVQAVAYHLVQRANTEDMDAQIRSITSGEQIAGNEVNLLEQFEAARAEQAAAQLEENARLQGAAFTMSATARKHPNIEIAAAALSEVLERVSLPDEMRNFQVAAQAGNENEGRASKSVFINVDESDAAPVRIGRSGIELNIAAIADDEQLETALRQGVEYYENDQLVRSVLAEAKQKYPQIQITEQMKEQAQRDPQALLAFLDRIPAVLDDLQKNLGDNFDNELGIRIGFDENSAVASYVSVPTDRPWETRVTPLLEDVKDPNTLPRRHHININLAVIAQNESKIASDPNYQSLLPTLTRTALLNTIQTAMQSHDAATRIANTLNSREIRNVSVAPSALASPALDAIASSNLASFSKQLSADPTRIPAHRLIFVDDDPDDEAAVSVIPSFNSQGAIITVAVRVNVHGVSGEAGRNELNRRVGEAVEQLAAAGLQEIPQNLNIMPSLTETEEFSLQVLARIANVPLPKGVRLIVENNPEAEEIRVFDRLGVRKETLVVVNTADLDNIEAAIQRGLEQEDIRTDIPKIEPGVSIAQVLEDKGAKPQQVAQAQPEFPGVDTETASALGEQAAELVFDGVQDRTNLQAALRGMGEQRDTAAIQTQLSSLFLIGSILAARPGLAASVKTGKDVPRLFAVDFADYEGVEETALAAVESWIPQLGEKQYLVIALPEEIDPAVTARLGAMRDAHSDPRRILIVQAGIEMAVTHAAGKLASVLGMTSAEAKAKAVRFGLDDQSLRAENLNEALARALTAGENFEVVIISQTEIAFVSNDRTVIITLEDQLQAALAAEQAIELSA